MWREVGYLVRGAASVGQAFVETQGEHLRLIACNSTLGAGLKSAQAAAEGCVRSLFAGRQFQVASQDFKEPSAVEDDVSVWSITSDVPSSEADLKEEKDTDLMWKQDLGTACPPPPGHTMNTRFSSGNLGGPNLGQTRAFRCYSTVRGLTAEDIRKARESKQKKEPGDQQKPPRQKVKQILQFKMAAKVNRLDQT